MNIADIFRPEWSLLLVRRDPRSNVIGVGLVAPEGADVGRPNTGEILARGPDAPPAYQKGKRVVFSLMAGHQISMANENNLVILPSSEVLAIGADSWDGNTETAEALELLEPPSGLLLVERLDTPVLRGRLHLPDHYSTATRSNEAIVRKSAANPETRRFREGEQVLLGASVARGFGLGLRGERKIFRCSEAEILGHVNGDVDPMELQPDLQAAAKTLRGEREFDDRFEEGDSSGVR